MEIEYRENMDVVNPARPEWGIGRILSIEPGPGGRGLRIRVNFPGAGVKAIMIPPGRLTLPEVHVDKDQQVKEALGCEKAQAAKLREVPAVIFDRLAGLEARIEALVKLYRFTDDPRGIFDWAGWKLGNKDPLSLFSADELDAYYVDFIRGRDRALRNLYEESVRAGLEAKFKTLLKKLAPEELITRIKSILGDTFET
jgi:hypothetical protein